jgi:integrase
VLAALARLPEDGRRRRLEFVLRFAYATGVRPSELVAARLADLSQVELGDGETGWMLRVLGKGGRVRQLPLSELVMDALAAYLRARSRSRLQPGAPRGLPPREDRRCARAHAGAARLRR